MLLRAGALCRTITELCGPILWNCQEAAFTSSEAYEHFLNISGCEIPGAEEVHPSGFPPMLKWGISPHFDARKFSGLLRIHFYYIYTYRCSPTYPITDVLNLTKSKRLVRAMDFQILCSKFREILKLVNKSN